MLVKNRTYLLVVGVVLVLFTSLSYLVFRSFHVSTSHQVTKVEVSNNDEHTATGAGGTKVFFSKYKGNDAIFLINNSTNSYFEAGQKKINPNLGELHYQENENWYSINRDLKSLEKPQLIYEDTTGSLVGANSFLLPDDRKYIYIVLSFLENGSNPTNAAWDELIRINLQTVKSEKVWELNIQDRKKYGDYLGSALLEVVVYPYVALTIGKCSECGPTEPGAVVIVNTITRKEILLGAATDLEFDLKGGNLKYIRLQKDNSTAMPTNIKLP